VGLMLKYTLATNILGLCFSATGEVAPQDQVGLVELYEHWATFALVAPPQK
jgi:hypothetical protein